MTKMALRFRSLPDILSSLLFSRAAPNKCRRLEVHLRGYQPSCCVMKRFPGSLLEMNRVEVNVVDQVFHHIERNLFRNLISLRRQSLSQYLNVRHLPAFPK